MNETYNIHTLCSDRRLFIESKIEVSIRHYDNDISVYYVRGYGDNN